MVRIRAAQASDAAGVRAVYAPFVTGTAATFEEEIPTVEAMQARMAAGPRLPWLVAEAAPDSGTDTDTDTGDRNCQPTPAIVGYAYAALHGERAAYRWSVNASVYLSAAFHRQGLGRRLYARLFAELRALGYLNVYAGITLPNAASVGLHTAVGFTPLGVYPRIGHKLGAWRDVGWYSLPLVTPLPAAPAEPRPWQPDAAPTRPTPPPQPVAPTLQD
ncbi:GNAT family N-acetyltransferase [Frankia sp. R82]|uniref:GNAT family N-acetyltransferase n=1 Tax=Frankia sp. R82 TaxID=2950553 RepID=UPI002043BFA1|nr:GNAT family N-acetyltransferase [Frankia sp. R82]MCM3887617.1 GNAT family N-acetyltransferase [Frankia sp. R82]